MRCPPLFFGIATARTGGGKITSRTHSVPDLVEIALQVLLELLDSFLVHAGRARIGFDQSVSS